MTNQKKIAIATMMASITLALTGCFDSEQTVEGRWYSQTQVEQGKEVFLTSCASCHGANAQGTKDWQTPLADGRYPPPPLNGSAHAWHHPLSMLQATVANGSLHLGGSMPPFKQALSDEQRTSAISYFQSKWPNEIYDAWIQRSGLE